MSELHAQTVAQVRDTMLPPVPPPRRETGAIRWLRQNLFSGPLNIILTVLAIWLLWVALRDVVPWAWRGVWRASSLNECRAIRDQLYPEGTSAACWAVLTDRWRQLVFGFYPASQIWRPPLALVVFLLAVSPILFARLPRRLLWLTPAAPFLIFWLLWGGTIWGPVAAALGFALGVAAFLALSRARYPILALLAGILLPVLYWSFVAGPLARALAGVAPLALPAVASKDFGGFTLSIIIGLSGISLSLPLGVLLALGRRSDMLIISKASVFYIEVIRGVPLIVWLFVAQLILNYFLPRGTNFDLMLRVIIMVTLFAAAYIAEVIRGGLAALPRGQYEAGDALGLTYWQAMQLIVLPQALKISIPGIVNSFIGLFKDTTLVSIIAMFDPIRMASSIRATTAWGGIYWELYVFIGLTFWVFCFSMSRYSIWLERRLERGHR
ncbi:Glutamate transport membrane-spanning protein [Rubellimicrobium mesophilum DSM 19309]|uniref:Glutamate transport membrane-spanning protein n=1 Tax=Rubellimicrobium mesophilum DSM 19309 TaxID=442562 RepID=A0A017HQZ9_9RHOB|nr:amino acid ABC transporter permease [Rubellimicrobium mesophilum]EYD76811.1 Glutamate transport membrane-spanning protein [Rubellimicrobium mesophilum DSM 19309]